MPLFDQSFGHVATPYTESAFGVAFAIAVRQETLEKGGSYINENFGTKEQYLAVAIEVCRRELNLRRTIENRIRGEYPIHEIDLEVAHILFREAFHCGSPKPSFTLGCGIGCLM